MSLDFRHWLAVACLLPALVLFAMSHDMPVFSHPERIASLNLHEEGADYRLKTERFNQAVKEELTPKLKLEARGLCFLALMFLCLLLPRVIDVSARRVLACGVGGLLAFPVLSIDLSIRDHKRGLYPAWADSLGPYWLVIMLVDMALLLLLLPFLYRAWRGLQGVGRVFNGAAAVLGLSCLALAIASLVQWDYVVLASAGLLTLFFTGFWLGAQARR